MKKFQLSDIEWIAQLIPEQYRIVHQQGTGGARDGAHVFGTGA